MIDYIEIKSIHVPIKDKSTNICIYVCIYLKIIRLTSEKKNNKLQTC